MYSFFVLGLIPGTTIQITFEMWIYIVADIATLLLLANVISLRRRRQLVRSFTNDTSSVNDANNNIITTTLIINPTR